MPKGFVNPMTRHQTVFDALDSMDSRTRLIFSMACSLERRFKDMTSYNNHLLPLEIYRQKKAMIEHDLNLFVKAVKEEM